MTFQSRSIVAVIGLGFCLVAPGTVREAGAQGQAGQIAAVWGEVRIERADATAPREPVGPGAAVAEGDRLITGGGDRAKIVLAEHSVVDLAPETEIVVRRGAPDPATGRIDSLIEVVRGKVRARLQTDAVAAETLYQVETPTAVVVRGTDFIVQYDPEREQTTVVGIREVADVLGRLAVAGGVVRVGSRESTVVRKGRYPVAPEAMPLDAFTEMLQGLTIVGTGAADGLAAMHPAVTGRLLSPRDLPGEPDPAAASRDGLRLEAPRRFLADEMSEDVYVNDQPLLEYERQQPGLPLPADEGGVVVEF